MRIRILLSVGVAMVAGSAARASAPAVRLSVHGPRPARIFELRAPDRIVLDFPGPPMAGYGEALRSENPGLPGITALRRGQVRDLGGPHARLTIVLPKRCAFRTAWHDSDGMVEISPSGSPAGRTSWLEPGPGKGASPWKSLKCA